GLPIKEGMQRVLSSMDFYLDNRLQCRHLHSIKLQEVFFTFRGFYKKEDMISFFAPILNKTVDFKDFVIANYQKVKTVEELSSLYGCSLRSFNRKFKQHFDDSPYNWMLRQKAKHVKAQLLTPGIEFSEIIKEFKFSSASHFSTYCKKQFGVTPRDIRKTVQK
ncbi:MAG: helix-turn-helix domain-containing protein, partial [Bacteroides sp.]